MNGFDDRVPLESSRDFPCGECRTGRGLGRLRGGGRNRSRCSLTFVWVLASICGFGCIERTLTINTEPEGATVFLNDQDVGRSPVRVPFTWYGDYDIVIRKPGFETIRTNHRIDTPWYEFPGIDIITECLIPLTVHDDRVLETYVMERQQHPTDQALLQAADDMRQRVQNPDG